MNYYLSFLQAANSLAQNTKYKIHKTKITFYGKI